MNKKTVNAILCKVHKEFHESISDPAVQELVRTNSIITGGSIVSLLTGEKVNDYDYYFTDKNTCKTVAKYFVEKFNKSHNMNARIEDDNDRIRVFLQSRGVAGDESETPFDQDYDPMQTNITPESDVENIEPKPKYEPVYITSNAITLRGGIQLVIRFYGDAEEIHKNFDFVHCTNYWTSKDSKLYLNQAALECILNHELLYIGSKYPLCSIIRTRKFIQRGWKINAGQYLKMAMQVSELDLSDIHTLEDQLVGVDAAFFGMLIEALKKRSDADEAFKLNSHYVAAIVDKIF